MSQDSVAKRQDTAELMRQALALHEGGRLAEAERLYRLILEQRPGHVDASHNLGVAAMQAGRPAEALPLLKAALEARPNVGQYWLSYIAALAQAGQKEAARQVLAQGRQRGLAGPEVGRLAARLGTGEPGGPAKQNLAFVQELTGLIAQGRHGTAEERARQHLGRVDDDGIVWKLLAVSCKLQGKDADALLAIEKAATFSPTDFEAHFNLGNALYEDKQLARALDSFTTAQGLNPGHAETRNNMGQVLLELGRIAEAAGQFRAALALKPNLAVAHNNLGNVLLSWREYGEAEGHYRQAMAIEPDNAEVICNLAVSMYEQSRFTEAEQLTRRALAINDRFSLAHLNLGHVLHSRGDFVGAEKCFRQAIACSPHELVNYDSLLFTLNYDPDQDEESIFAAYRDFDREFGAPMRTRWPTHRNDRQVGRRLRVGYVSPDLRQHTVGHFLEPLLSHHDKHAVEVYAYAELKREDAATARFRGYVDHWRPTLGKSDEAVFEQIREDEIDILVDLAGHTPGHRLLVFARKPAPVSVTWLGYGYTTGLSAIDYFLGDGAIVPPGSEHLFSETPWRLDRPSFAYRPPEGMGEVNVLPALEEGHVTFGTLTRSVRVNHRVVRVWSEILKRVPNARLVIDSRNYAFPEMQETLAGKFVARGVAPDRVRIGYNPSPWDVLRSTDIGLDCFPHNSGTTLFESLYMGVPYVTLAGRPSVGRLGSSILEGAGHAEWIARSEEEYIDRAVALASDLPRLAAIRANLRAEMQSSPLMDEVGFARKVEAAYREMFKRWSEGQR